MYQEGMKVDFVAASRVGYGLDSFFVCANLFGDAKISQKISPLIVVGFLRGGCSRGGGNWGTLRIPREDWGTLGNIREDWGNHHPPLKNPIR